MLLHFTCQAIVVLSVRADRPQTELLPARTLYSAPTRRTVFAANAGGKTYDVTITPSVSYPLGGWVYYTIATAAGSPPINQGFTCL